MAEYIDRQAAIEKLISNLTYMHTFGADRSIDLIEELPSADVQPVRHGHWIKHSPCQYECNICGKVVVADDANELNYCCNCGTIMDEVTQ